MPGPVSPAPAEGREWRSEGFPVGAPCALQVASVFSSTAVRRRWLRPMIGAESGPGIHGGMRPAFVIRAIPAACDFASSADVSGNGAIPPSRWHEAHFESRIGATSR